MVAFPIALLSAKPGSLRVSEDGYSIEVPIEPFDLDVEGERVTVKTALRMDAVNLPSIDLPSLAGRRFDFPLNPEDGYIDASIYIEHAHHPVDVTSLQFGSITIAGVEVAIAGKLILEVEGLGDYEDTEFTLTTTLRRARK